MAGGVPEFWGRLNGEISRIEMAGLTVLREVGRLKEAEHLENREGNGST